MKRFISILLTVATLFSVFAMSGCNGTDASLKEDENSSSSETVAVPTGTTTDLPFATEEITETNKTDDAQNTALPEETIAVDAEGTGSPGATQTTSGTTATEGDSSAKETDSKTELSTATSTATSASAPKTKAPAKTATSAPKTTAPDKTASATKSPTSAAKTATPSATAAVAEITIIDKNGKTSYAIYRDKWAEDLVVTGGTLLRDLIKQKTGVQLQYLTDDKTSGTKEILIGNTNRAISDDAMVGLLENQFRFLYKNGSLAIVATNDNILELAVRKFVEEYVKNGVIKIPENLDRKWQCEPKSSTAVTAQNPITKPGDDPFVTYRNGTYYYVYAEKQTSIKVATAPSLDKISRDNAKTVFTAPTGTDYSKNYWAPEMFYLQGNWYIYFAADDGNDVNHRMHVLKCTTQNPTDPFEYIGKIADTKTDKWAIDGTILEYKNELYMIWSGWQGDNNSGNQHLYIAHMSDPCTIDGPRKLISSPTYSWEGNLNEGPCILKRGGKIYLLFSAYGAWTQNYCVGYLELTGTDPLAKSSWKKCSAALLKKSSTVLAPGHNCVVPAPDGSWWIVYHAQPSPFVMWENRNLWIQKIEFNSNGTLKTIKSTNSVTLTVPNGWVVKNEIK